MRKFLLTFVFLPFFTLLYSQEPEDISIDSLLVNIDLSSLTSQTLYDRVTPWSALDIFNDSINIADTKFFEQSLYELQKASLDQKFTSYESLRNYYAPDSLSNILDIAILNASFQKLNFNESNELSGALRITDSLFERISNNQSTFLDAHVLMIAPTKPYVVGNEITFRINSDLIIQETTDKSMISLTGNFEMGDDILLIDNGTILVNELNIPYIEAGDKVLTFTAQFADGSSKSTQAVVNVSLPLPPNDPLIENGSVWATIPWQGFNESEPYLGKLDYRIFYHTNNGNSQKTLLKPIVIIDGFDPGDRRKIQDSDPHPLQSNAEHNSIEEMMMYTNSNGESVPIIPLLRGLGYDVVIVNHPNHWYNGFKIDGGADYIERNALTHVQLYQKLNLILSQNNSSEELVIVGPSMGGQISRYALAYMEQHEIPHNTRLWVSVDSPHLGANIPLGLQTLLNLLKDVTGSVAAIDFVDNQLGSAAARQQLIEQYSGATNNQLNQNWLDGRTQSQGFSQNKGRPIFINYYNNLFNNGLPGSNGYPQNLRKIAIANGSLKNKRLFDNPFEANSPEFTGSTFPDNFANHGVQSLKIEGFTNILGHTATMESYMMPNTNSSHKVAFFKKKMIFWNYFDRYVTNNNSRGNLDNIPGGWFPSQRDLADSVINSTPCEWMIGQFCINDWNVEALKHVNSFIPVISALGFQNPDFNWNADLNRNLVCTNEIPFDSYYGPKKNEQHTSFTEESVEWLLEELAGSPQPPTVYFNASNLMGPDAVCQSDLVTYEFDSCTPQAVQQWQVSNGLQIITSDDLSVTVKNNTSANKSGWIKAIFSNQVVQKNLWLGRPTVPEFLTGPEVVETGAVVTYNGGIAEGATSYEWWLPYPFEIQNPYNTSSPYWQIYPNAGRTTQVFTGNGGIGGYVQLMGVNSCGNGDAAILSVEHGQGGGGGQQLPVYPFPNTSDDAFNLDFSTYPSGTYEIYIYDVYSNMMYQGNSSNIEKTISTLDMNEGTYFLHIHIDGEILQYQLIINH